MAKVFSNIIADSRNKIIQVDKEKLIELLNKLHSDEWLAYYNYYVAAIWADKNHDKVIVEELVKHSMEEKKHASWLANRISQLGGKITPDLSKLVEHKICPNGVSESDDLVVLLKQSKDGESCAIEAYNEAIEFVKDKDIVTEDILRKILAEEIEHEDDLSDFLEKYN